jgi:hypothetical protein
MTRTMALVVDRELPEDIRNQLIEKCGAGIKRRIAEGELGWRDL